MGLGLITARRLAATLLMAGAIVGVAAPAAAHTDFESSAPGDGAVVDGPVTEIVVTFTSPASPVDEGFSVFDGEGAVRSPSSIEITDGRSFTLGFDPALGAGTLGVRWKVQAPDAHPIEGTFSFTATAPPQTTTTSRPESSVGTEHGADRTPTSAPVESTIEAPDVDASARDDPAAHRAALTEFLADDSASAGEGRRLVGRILSLVATMGALGGLAFLTTMPRGSDRETAAGRRLIAWLGMTLAVGATIEFWGLATLPDHTATDVWRSAPGLAAALRIGGGTAIAVGAWRWTRRHPPAVVVGASATLASFWFDGHTVSSGPRVVHAAVNSVHVAAGAVWAGGLAALAITLWSRRRRHEPTGATVLVVRFSSVATVALLAVVLAGAVMAILVLDSPGELTSTEWGRTLLVKTGLVGVAAVGGAHNHFTLRPALEASPDDSRLTSRVRATVTAEAVVLFAATALTARLVTAAT